MPGKQGAPLPPTSPVRDRMVPRVHKVGLVSSSWRQAPGRYRTDLLWGIKQERKETPSRLSPGGNFHACCFDPHKLQVGERPGALLAKGSAFRRRGPRGSLSALALNQGRKVQRPLQSLFPSFSYGRRSVNAQILLQANLLSTHLMRSSSQ